MTAWQRFRPGLWTAFALAAAGVAILNLLPIAWLGLGSLKMPGGGLGFGRYVELFERFSFTGVLVNSWIYALGTTLLSLVVGVALAVLVARTDLPGKAMVRFTALFAFVSPPWLTAMAYVILASPNAGYLNLGLEALIGVKPLNIHSMPGMIYVSSLFLYAYVFLTVEAALAGLDGAYEEAARVTGASALTVIRRVTLPLVAPSLIAAAIFSLIIAWGLFATPAILGMPARIYVFATQLYLFLNGFPPRYEVAAAMGVLFCLVAFLLGGLLWLTRRRRDAARFAVIGGKGRRPSLLPLGRARPFAAAFAILVSLLAVILPYVVILWMSLNTAWFGGASLKDLSFGNFSYVLTGYSEIWRVIGNTLAIAGMEAGIVLVLAFTVAYLARRTTLPGRDLLSGAAYLTVLVPGTAFVIGVIWAWIKSPLGLYGGIVLIALAQAARSLPLALRNIGDGLGQVDRSLEEAAVICGAGRLTRIRAVLAPLLRPVLLGAFALVFLSGLRDLNTPLFLGGGSSDTLTLAVVIFNFWSESRMGESAALTILLLGLTLVIFLPLHLFVRVRQ